MEEKPVDPYTLSGVNVEAGDDFSKAAAKVCASSWNNNPHAIVHNDTQGNFRGLRGFGIVTLQPGYRTALFPDGVGTKSIIITAADKHLSAGSDLVAMCADDAAFKGALPVAMANVLEVGTLGEANSPTNRSFRDLIVGLGAAAKNANLILLSGETAEMGDCIGSENPAAVTRFNWSGSVTGIYYPDSIITGETITEGMIIVSLREYGARSNYFSAIRRAFRLQFGTEWYANSAAMSSIRQAAEASTIYAPLLTHVHGWSDPHVRPIIRMHGAAHITGGGIEGKLGKDLLFPLGLSAELHALWEVPEILQKVAGWNPETTAANFYQGSSGGNGGMVILEEKDVQLFCEIAAEYGIQAKVCGKVTKGVHPQIRLISRLPGDDEVIYNAGD